MLFYLFLLFYSGVGALLFNVCREAKHGLLFSATISIIWPLFFLAIYFPLKNRGFRFDRDMSEEHFIHPNDVYERWYKYFCIVSLVTILIIIHYIISMS